MPPLLLLAGLTLLLLLSSPACCPHPTTRLLCPSQAPSLPMARQALEKVTPWRGRMNPRSCAASSPTPSTTCLTPSRSRVGLVCVGLLEGGRGGGAAGSRRGANCVGGMPGSVQMCLYTLGNHSWCHMHMNHMQGMGDSRVGGGSASFLATPPPHTHTHRGGSRAPLARASYLSYSPFSVCI